MDKTIYIFQSTLRRTERLYSSGWCKSSALFQSTLRRTERLLYETSGSKQYDFNPRSDERSDGNLSPENLHTLISIHAPTNGATPVTEAGLCNAIFQSTLRRTERRGMVTGMQDPLIFQSTLRRTERRSCRWCWLCSIQISIHAPTNGATGWSDDKIIGNGISIHAPTNGATAILHKKMKKLYKTA